RRRFERYPRADAEAHAEVGRLAQGAGHQGTPEGPGQSARAHRKGREGTEGDQRWTVRRGEGHRRRVHTGRGEGHRAGGGPLRRLPDLRHGRVRRGSPDNEDVAMEPGDHLFRREAGRMVAALTRLFGVHNLDLAEDVVQDAFCRALEVWKLRGVPENPSAWLMATAKNRALDILRRERTARRYAPEL